MTEHSIVNKAKELKDWLVSIRRELHKNPELSFQEVETAKFVARKLSDINGMEVKTGVKETGIYTGVIGTLSSGDGPTIAIRADMDALPISELNDHSYVSKNEGVMHACGHDAHTTIGLGIARLIAGLFQEEKISGTVKFIFQPAEEAEDENGSTGSPYMIKAGVLKDVDAVLALHMDPEKPIGEVKINSGYSMASIDSFRATILGSGGHAAYPHQGTDPIWMLSFVMQAIYGIISRKVSPLEPAVISITNVETKSSYNVIPNEVSIKGSIRSYDANVRKEMQQELDQALKIVKSLGGDYRLSIQHGEPALNNHKKVAKWIEGTVKDILPDFTIHEVPYGMGGEDFSYMIQEKPGAMFFIGAGVEDNDEDRGLHTPKFDINEDVLAYGAAILTETASRYLQGKYQLDD